MPVQRCKKNGKPGWKWGRSGACYTGAGARVRADRQGRAAHAGGYTGNQTFERTKVVPGNPLKADPTRTTTLRRVFESDVKRRFARVLRAIRELVVVEDAFGIKRDADNPFTGNVLANTRWRFRTTHQKILAFQQWIAAQVGSGILGGAAAETLDDAYWNQYVEEGYKKGAGRAFDDARKAGVISEDQLEFYNGTRQEFLRSSFARPESIEKVKLLASRVFTDLKNVTEDMAARMSRILMDGLVRGDNPNTIARGMSKDLGISLNRAKVIARTEIVRAHAEGQLDALKRLGVEEVGVMVEWSTAGDDRVCPRCEALDGVVLKLKEASGIIPRHPSCRCSFIPANVGEPIRGQKRSPIEIRTSFRDSIKAEVSKRSRRSVATQRKLSSWPGAGRNISKRRPKRDVAKST